MSDDRAILISPSGDELRIIVSGDGYVLKRYMCGDWVIVGIREYPFTIFGKLCEMLAEAGVFDAQIDEDAKKGEQE